MMRNLLVILLLAFSTLANAQTYREITLADVAARTSTGAGSVVPTDSAGVRYLNHSVRVFIDVSAVSGGTPSMTVSLRGFVKGNDYIICSSGAITSSGKFTFRCDDVPSDMSASWSISGTTPSFTFGVYVTRH